MSLPIKGNIYTIIDLEIEWTTTHEYNFVEILRFIQMGKIEVYRLIIISRFTKGI